MTLTQVSIPRSTYIKNDNDGEGSLKKCITGWSYKLLERSELYCISGIRKEEKEVERVTYFRGDLWNGKTTSIVLSKPTTPITLGMEEDANVCQTF